MVFITLLPWMKTPNFPFSNNFPGSRLFLLIWAPFPIKGWTRLTSGSPFQLFLWFSASVCAKSCARFYLNSWVPLLKALPVTFFWAGILPLEVTQIRPTILSSHQQGHLLFLSKVQQRWPLFGTRGGFAICSVLGIQPAAPGCQSCISWGWLAGNSSPSGSQEGERGE